jgi:lipid-A-disaccharide synthase
MIDAARRLKRKRPEAQAVVALAPNRSREEAEAIIEAARQDSRGSLDFHITQHETREALAAADAAAVASGTATLEAALVMTPFVIVYKESFINWHTLGRLISAEHFGLINLIAGERLVTELMQNDLTGERLAQELLKLLDKRENETLRARLKEATAKLGTGGASTRAAHAILRALRDWNEKK